MNILNCKSSWADRGVSQGWDLSFFFFFFGLLGTEFVLNDCPTRLYEQGYCLLLYVAAAVGVFAWLRVQEFISLTFLYATLWNHISSDLAWSSFMCFCVEMERETWQSNVSTMDEHMINGLVFMCRCWQIVADDVLLYRANLWGKWVELVFIIRRAAVFKCVKFIYAEWHLRSCFSCLDYSHGLFPLAAGAGRRRCYLFIDSLLMLIIPQQSGRESSQ